ncbi:MAG TPA: AAA family ATPase [Pyrinomonadaceae bacterium]|nr:AAA family ATPase [Pyrinomonadaceae bacterium]
MHGGVRGDNCIVFEPFCLDRSNECLWRGSEVIKLRPKAYAVLNQLVERSGHLVTKEELLANVWPETFVTDAVLKVTIRQLRDALDDDPKAPLFIETAHRRGYRFIGNLANAAQLPGISTTPRPRDDVQPLGFVGRNEVLSRMRSSLEKILQGERQIVFVTGEPGIGKTALVDTFARYLAFDHNIRIGRGQCLEQYGTNEAYLPILDAMADLGREDQKVVDVLRAHAPMWLLQMPALLSAAEREALSREVLGATRERMLREMGEALEVLTSEQPLVLILEDLHWSDNSTLDLISYLATRVRPAHLMLIGTYRTADLIASGHPLKAVKQELLAKKQCEELPLDYLSAEAIEKYLSVIFPSNRFPNELAGLIHERTEGNPLFMVNAVEYLLTEGLIVKHEGSWELVVEIEKVEVGVPDSIKQMIEKQLDNLNAEDARTLEAASLAGAEFSTLAVVAALEEDCAAVEARCDRLARQRQFIHDCGVQVLPNGEIVGRYGFIHALYQNVLYDRVSPSRRVELHRRIGARGEEVFGERAREIAAELAVHFERGGDYRRASKYLQRAAENALRRFAYQEAATLAQRGLELVERVPKEAERANQELCLQLTLGIPLIATQGYAAPGVGQVYTRARELCRQIGDTPDISEALWGLRAFYISTAELGKAQEIAKEFLDLAERLPYAGLAMRGHLAMVITSVHMGQLAPALEHFEKALLLFNPEQHRNDSLYYAQNPGVAMRCYAAWALWISGQPDQSLTRIQEAIDLARELCEPPGLAYACYFAATVHQLRREPRQAQEQAEAALAVDRTHRLTLYHAHAEITRGWALFEQGSREEGIEQMRQGLAVHQATGAKVIHPHFLTLLGEALGKSGETEQALRLLDEALETAQRNQDENYLAEIYRIKGELTGDEECFNQSLRIARRQQAKSWELRTAMSLAHRYQRQGRQEEARALLAPVYNSFTEGFDTVDLREAKALLDNHA